MNENYISNKIGSKLYMREKLTIISSYEKYLIPTLQNDTFSIWESVSEGGHTKFSVWKEKVGRVN